MYPPGFVITTAAHAAAGAARLGPRRTSSRPIRAAYADLGGGPVAVRSSATAEDLPGAAFAGQQDTFLDVEGEDALIDAVRRCWASLWSERAVAYRERRAGDTPRPHGRGRAADVAGQVAGVLFTANPVTGDLYRAGGRRRGGLGEAVVSGTVTA